MRWSVAIVAIGCASAVQAQEPRRLNQPDSIPSELATALAASGGLGGEPLILVGAMPEFASKLLVVPAGGRVLGSAYLGTTLVGIVRLPSASDSLVVQTSTALRPLGWEPPPSPPNYGGGFRPAGFNAAPAGLPRTATLCKSDQMLAMTATRVRGGTNLVYRLSAAPQYSTCHPPAPPNMSIPRAPMPTLYNPPEMADPRAPNDCAQNGSLSNGSGTILRTSLPTDSIANHYMRQMIDSGWTPAVGAQASATRTFLRPDTSGTLEATLTVNGRGVACREVSLQIRTRKP